MTRVKFNVNTEYAYIQNFKVLQSQYRRIVSKVSSQSSTNQSAMHDRLLPEAPDR